MKKFLAVLKARTMEFVRDRGTFVWNLLFPILMVAGFAVAFSGNGKTLFSVGIVGDRAAFERDASGDSRAAMRSFLAIPEIKTIPYAAEAGRNPLEIALDRLRKHQLDMVVDLDERSYYLNDRSPGSATLARLLALERTRANEAGSAADGGATAFEPKAVTGAAIRYVDWLVPGVIGLNMMFSCLFGVGFVLVRYRKNGVLKRLKATPVGAFNFLAAQTVSRFIIAFATSLVVFAGTNAFLRFRMEGSYLLLAAMLSLGILSMISLGLLFAARFRSEELASGIINLVTYPMMVFSGVFFSLEGSPAFLRNGARAFPLTHFLEGSRAIMLDGAGLSAVWPQMAILAGMSVLFLGLATALFKWE